MAASLENLRQASNERYTFFDLLSILCWAVHERASAQQEMIYQYFRSNYELYYKNVRTQFPFLCAGVGQSVVYYYDLKPEDASKVLGFLSSADSHADWATILAVIEAVDRLIELKANLQKYLLDKRCPVKPLGPAGEQKPTSVSQHYYSFDALNPGTTAYGILLPQESCRWKRAGSRNMDSVAFHPMCVMKNYLWVPPGHGYQIVNLYSDFQLGSDQRLKVVTSPLSSQAPFLLHCREETKKFEIEYLDACTPTINDHLKKAINISVQEQAHILLFPEMMASPDSIHHCAEYIRDNWTLDFPNLILLPTCEYKDEKGWVNDLTALDSDGNCIFSYHKQHPFQLDRKCGGESSEAGLAPSDSFFEPIHADNIIYILHVPDIGRIGFLICSDVFQEGYLDYLTQQLKITLLLHIVCSPGEDLLLRKLATANRDMCDVILCNTCAAWDNAQKDPESRPRVEISDRPMINIYLPYGHKYNERLPLPVTCEQESCTGCAFVMELANKYQDRAVPIDHRNN